MSVIFIGMDMPKCCASCRCSGTDVCRKWMPMDLDFIGKKVHDDCPLKPVDGLTKRIEDECPSNQCTGELSGYADAIKDVLEIIKQYCEKEKAK